MRPTPKSHFRNPLEVLLNSVGALRVLRVLASHGGALPASALVDQTRLTRSVVHHTLKALTEEGIIQTMGRARSVLYQFDGLHPLASALQALFEAETQRADRVLEAIRTTADRLAPSVLAAWLFGSVARGEDTSRSDLDVAIVVDQEPADDLTHRVADELAPVEAAERVVISVVGLSRSDLLRLPSLNPQFWASLRQDAVVLTGPGPESLATTLKIEQRRTASATPDTHTKEPADG